jgi:putative transposase
MKGKRYSEAQIIAALKEHEAGARAAEVCRRLGIVENTFSLWKAKYGGMEVSEAKRLKELELENSKLKRLLAESLLDNAALKDVLSKKW